MKGSVALQAVTDEVAERVPVDDGVDAAKLKDGFDAFFDPPHAAVVATLGDDALDRALHHAAADLQVFAEQLGMVELGLTPFQLAQNLPQSGAVPSSRGSAEGEGEQLDEPVAFVATVTHLRTAGWWEETAVRRAHACSSCLPPGYLERSALGRKRGVLPPIARAEQLAALSPQRVHITRVAN